jgi:tripartite-type tricarboxylate transporter receptor subunit TctC
VAKLNSEVVKILAMPDAQQVLLAGGLEAAPSSPSEMRRIIEADYKKWGDFIKITGLKTE